MKKTIAFLLLSVFSVEMFSQLKINEVSYANKSTLVDEDL